MKKVLLCFILVVFIGCLTLSVIKLNSSKNQNNSLKKEINELNKNIEKVKEDNTKYENELSNLKNESKEKLEEQEIWKKAKEKLNQAL